MDRTRIRAEDERSGMICVTPFFRVTIQTTSEKLVRLSDDQAIFSRADVISSFQTNVWPFPKAFWSNNSATNLFEPTDPTWGGRDGGNLPFSDHWKCQRGRWGGGPSFWVLTPMLYMNEAFCKGSTQQTSLGCGWWDRFRFRRCFDGLKIVAVSHRDGLDGCTPTCTHARHAQERTFLNLIIISTSTSISTPTSTFISNVISSSQ